ncbi:DNA internalization-related competence protein ComEC/Rec2 [Colwellia sp. 12G3]|uniref:DNA internalization-related competence protein ComEC/Rec2 n=1 Tax=Colwellia sp. 12G3 TaxID=2058299 RepID=UPI000C31BA8D|nr:DNA internalization-related competence protein ComEC/Rec2 [Colwellia sp. 12G3]PKI17479.1 DNA internalization-related competence protein ComEC/Rec2 [Colwellia sp. 12G3]
MDWWLLTFFLGAVLSLFLPEVPALFQLFLLLCFAVGFFSHKKLRRSSGLCFGALWILSQAYLYQGQLPNNFIDQMQNKQPFVVEGEVLSIQVKPLSILDDTNAGSSTRQQYDVTKRFNFRVSKVNQQHLKIPFVIRLSWNKSSVDVSQGGNLLLNVKLKPAHGLANIGTFNYLSWLKSHHIVATGYVVNPRKSKTPTPTPKNSLEQKSHANTDFNYSKNSKILADNKVLIDNVSFRQVLLEHYQGLTPNHQLTPILLALTFGERSLLSPEHWQILQATGTSHLIAISGLHVGLLAGSSFFIVMLFFQYLPLKNPHWQRGNIRYIAIAVSVLLATIYAYLAGFSLPTQRALVMLNLYWLSRLVGIKLSPKRLILLTLFILLIISPFSLLTASFWLSFYAVAIIFVTLWRFKSWLYKGSTLWRFVKGLFVIQVALTVMLIPITALFFQQMSLVSLLANIIAVPWMSFFSIPTALVSVLLVPLNESLAQWFMMVSLESLTWLWHYLDFISNIPNAIISLSLAQQLIVLILGIAAFLMLYLSPFIWHRRLTKSAILLMSLALSLSLISIPFPSFSTVNTFFSSVDKKDNTDENTDSKEYDVSPWQVVFFDVGQGLSVLIRRNGHAILYDTGAAYPSGFTLSDAVILPYLQYSAINRLDKVILSHSDNDHAGGIKILIDNIMIDEIISNDKNIVNSGKAISPTTVSSLIQVPINDCNSSQSFSWQDLRFDILWPLALKASEIMTINTKQKNDDSCVILISDHQGHKLLLTGDISAKVEHVLLELYPLLSADILQVPHHGSKTSSSQAFLSQLSPKVALVSAGYINRWYMPVAEVKQRYHDANITLLNSAELGQIIITLDENGIKTKSYVEDLRPFWFSH